ncbi:hypothetical protein ACG2F4_07005 [Halalkalibaculum sp. DA3122]|uniref:hypothetical protein n=1 Tax=unclassified Halalkalibaculum TaxID=2964617 RepID=UPI003754B3ED
MNIAQSRASESRNVLFLLLVVSCVTLLVGCDESGVVGGGFTDSDTTIKVDTLMVDGIETESYNFYSGNLTYFTPGQFSDPLFGDMKVTGLLRPQLLSGSAEMAPDANMKLRLVFNQELVYGDTTQPAEYDIVELDQVWRGRAWKLHDEPGLSGNAPLASFTAEKEDSVDIPLSGSWVQSYRDYTQMEGANRDSLYRIEFPGLALVPKNSAKLLPVDAQASKFIIENPESDTLEVAPRDWANSLERTNVPDTPDNTFKLHSTLEQVVSFDMDLTRENIGSVNLSKVELVLYEDTQRLENTMDQVSPTAGRGPISEARLQILDPADVPISLQTGSVLSNGSYNEEDGSYRFNITSFTNSVLLDGLPSELKFYVSLETNNGIIRSSLIHNEQAPEAKRPKLIVTYVKNQENTD